MEDHQEMLQDEDTQSAVKDKNADNMRIQDDTQWAFGDPAAKDRRMRIPDDPDVRDQFLQAFREMIDAGSEAGYATQGPAGAPRFPSTIVVAGRVYGLSCRCNGRLEGHDLQAR